MFRKLVLFFTFLMISLSAYSGEIKIGSVPSAVVYQGRVEKDNAPLNGLVHIIFKIYQYLTGGNPLWTSEEFLTEAKSGVFSITFEPPLDILSKGNQLYLEVVIEGEALSPREPIQSVLYALIAKKLEDGTSVHFSSITVGRHSVVDTSGLPQTPTAIIVDGGIYTNRVCFTETKGCLVSNDIGTITGGELSSPSTSYIIADNGNSGSGDIIFRIFESPKAIITHSGNLGIGITNPVEKLVVGGNSIINNNLTVGGNLLFSGILNNGIIRGLNNEQINIGSENDRIDFVINGSTTVTVNKDRLGIGVISPSEALDVNGNINSKSIITGSLITISTEIRSSSGENLIIQNSNLANVGIGTDTPKAKLHVGGSILADLGISASTATFTSDVDVLGDFTANSFGRKVSLSSTTIYGTLNVIGQFSLNNDNIATRGSTQTFTGQNTFLNQLLISSNAFISGAVGIGADGLRYTDISPSYLQIGDSYVVSSTATLYMSAGANANSNINFYRGPNKIASIGTNGNNIQLNYGNSNLQKIYLDNSYFKIYRSTVIISPSASDTSPAIYVDGNSNVGIGTLSSSQERLNVAGKIKLNGLGSGIVFNDGTILTSSNSISVGSIYNTGTVFITANSDNSGNDSMYLNIGNNTAIFIDNTSKVGIGTVHPSVLLDIIGGNVKIGNTAIYSPQRNGNLMVEGDVVVDGTFKQRSSTPVEFTSLSVSQNVYLSTSTGNTGIGTTSPLYKLDVAGDINLNGSLRLNGTDIINSGRNLYNLSSISSGGTINFSSLTANRLVATDGSKNLQSGISAGNLFASVTGVTGTAGNLVFSNGPSFTYITVTGSGTFTNTGDYSIKTSSGIQVGGTGTLQVGGLSANSLVATDGSKNLTNTITSSNLAASIPDETGTGNLVFNTAPSFNTGITVSGYGNFTSGITASSGTFTNTGDYSIKTSSGIYVDTGTINLNNSARIKNVPEPLDNQDAATKYYVDQIGGGGSDSGAWVKGGNYIISKNKFGSTNNKDVIFIRNDSEQFRMESSDVKFLVKVIANNGLDISAGSLNISALTASSLVATDGSKNLTSSITSANLAASVTDETGTGNLVFNTAPSFNTGITVSGYGNFTSGITASSGTFTNTSDYSIKTSSGIQVGGTGTLQVGGLSASRLVATDGSKNLTNTITSSNLAASITDETGTAGNLVFSNAPTLTNITVIGSGTFTNSGDYSIKTSSGIKVGGGTIQISGFTTAGFVKNDASGNLSGGNTIADSDIPSTIVRTSRAINTTSPLSGGGDLTSNRTLAIGGLSSIGTVNYVVGVNNGATGWEYKNIVGVAGEIDIAHSAGQIQIGIVDPLSVSKGGTGLSSAGGTGNRVLRTTDGSSFSVGTIDNNYLSAGSYTNITGVGTLTVGTWNANVIGLSYGGTNKNLTAANGGVVWTDSDSMEVTSAGSAGQVLLSAGAASPTWGTVGLKYGGTGADLSGASNLPVKKSGTSLTAAAIDLSGSEVSNTLPVSKGGTGNTSFTNNRPVIYDGSKFVSSSSSFSGSFTVVTSTTTPQSCIKLTYEYGILASTATVTCP